MVAALRKRVILELGEDYIDLWINKLVRRPKVA